MPVRLGVRVDRLAKEGERFTLRAGEWRHERKFQGLPPTGKQVTITGISVYRVANAKLVEGWTDADMLGLLQQLDAVPSPAQA